MILMPGFDGTGELFAPLTAALPPSYRSTVIRYRDERMFDDYVNTVSAALPDEGAILIAESFSGPIALAAMARHPTKIRCAVLCATFVESPFIESLPGAIVRKVEGPHLLLQTRPNECARLIDEFVVSTSSRAATIR